ncbi:MAG: hypothetical protein JKY52_09170 [Flavobacteriales bacterium]|nr:hypothetical protein [Flavobacteriales bacterium]
MSDNTFGDYIFDGWIPGHEMESIRSFWGCMDRTYKDWIENGELGATETCQHGPGPNGFGNPPYGATVDYMLTNYKLSKDSVNAVYNIVRGRYVHAWNNMGRLIDENGESHCVSSCNHWVRVYLHGEINHRELTKKG